jgi:hypothetical protein
LSSSISPSALSSGTTRSQSAVWRRYRTSSNAVTWVERIGWLGEYCVRHRGNLAPREVIRLAVAGAGAGAAAAAEADAGVAAGAVRDADRRAHHPERRHLRTRARTQVQSLRGILGEAAGRRRAARASREEGFRDEFVGEVADHLIQRISPGLWKLSWRLMQQPQDRRRRTGLSWGPAGRGTAFARWWALGAGDQILRRW